MKCCVKVERQNYLLVYFLMELRDSFCGRMTLNYYLLFHWIWRWRFTHSICGEHGLEGAFKLCQLDNHSAFRMVTFFVELTFLLICVFSIQSLWIKIKGAGSLVGRRKNFLFKLPRRLKSLKLQNYHAYSKRLRRYFRVRAKASQMLLRMSRLLARVLVC